MDRIARLRLGELVDAGDATAPEIARARAVGRVALALRSRDTDTDAARARAS
jgi:hypothetical protein